MRLLPLLALSVLVLACAPLPAARPDVVSPDTQPAASKRTIIAVVANVPTLIDRMSAGGVGVPGLTDLEKLISPGLAIVDDRGSLRPLVAERVPSVENGLWRTFPDGRMETTWKIRPGAQWQDAAAFSSADLVFTAAVDQDNDIPMRRNLAYASVDSVQAPDPLTLTVQWKRPYIQADQLFTLPLFPKHHITFTSWLVIYPQFLNSNPAVVGELQFRRALMHAIDRQQMAETLQAGLVPVAHTFVHPSEPEYREVESSVVKYDYDPRRATQIIEGLGYVKGADGVYRDAGNQRLSIEVRTSPEQDIQVKSLFVLADYWQRIGVAAEPIVMAEQRVRDREYVQTFPAFLMYRQPNDPNGLLLRLYGAQTPLPENNFVGRNHPRYMNAEFDTLLDRYYTAIPLRDRTRVLGQIINHTTERLTLMGLFYDVEPVLIANRLINVAASKARDSTPVWNADQWDIRG